MKKLLIILLFSPFLHAQSDEAKQLLLNVEKLAQFQRILGNMKNGYDIIYKGYTSVKKIAEGNFNLHENFLNGLLQVNPVVRNYSKVKDIFLYQARIVKEYQMAWRQFRMDRNLTIPERSYLGKVYLHLLRQSLEQLSELTLIITSGKLRMSDDERLRAIDQIFEKVAEQYSFLNEFNNSTAILTIQREKDLMDIDLMKKVHGQ